MAKKKEKEKQVTEELNEPKKIRCDTVPEEVLARAIRNNRGLQYLAAEEVGIAYSSMSVRISKSPYLQKVREEAINRKWDIAEKNLAELTEEKNLGSICFLLKTQAKHRGYTETTEVSVSPDVLKHHSLLMEQLAEFQASRKISANKDKTEENS